MANTNINIRMDIDLKRQFEAFCADMGMSMSTAFTIFARKAVREYRIPFEIDGIAPNPETIKAIEEVQRMKADHEGLAPRCIRSSRPANLEGSEKDTETGLWTYFAD